MIEKYLNNHFITLYFIPLIIGSLTVFSFQPFNFTFINFIVLPILFYLINYIKKNQRVSTEKNHILKTYLFSEPHLVLHFI